MTKKCIFSKNFLSVATLIINILQRILWSLENPMNLSVWLIFFVSDKKSVISLFRLDLKLSRLIGSVNICLLIGWNWSESIPPPLILKQKLLASFCFIENKNKFGIIEIERKKNKKSKNHNYLEKSKNADD